MPEWWIDFGDRVFIPLVVALATALPGTYTALVLQRRKQAAELERLAEEQRRLERAQNVSLDETVADGWREMLEPMRVQLREMAETDSRRREQLHGLQRQINDLRRELRKTKDQMLEYYSLAVRLSKQVESLGALPIWAPDAETPDVMLNEGND